MKKNRTGYEILTATVQEMGEDPAAGIDIPVDQAKLKSILEQDEHPRFVTLQVAREGVSKNRRNYSAELIESIAEQINASQPIGGAGHIPDDQRSHSFPATEAVWLGAVVREIDGKKVVYAKGYILPDAHNRWNYLKVAKAMGKNVAVSIYGQAKEAVYNAVQKAYDIKGLALERIDFTPPNAEGIPNDGTLILTSEMADTRKKKQGDKTVEREEVIKDLKLSEMQQHNPKLIEEIQGQSTTVSEMANVRKALGIKDTDDAGKAIAEMQQRIREQELDTELRNRVKVPAARGVIRQMAIAEMRSDASAGKTVAEIAEAVLATDDAKAYITSKSGAPGISPTNDTKHQKSDRKFTTITE